jgi:hypothetical protein
LLREQQAHERTFQRSAAALDRLRRQPPTAPAPASAWHGDADMLSRRRHAMQSAPAPSSSVPESDATTHPAETVRREISDPADPATSARKESESKTISPGLFQTTAVLVLWLLCALAVNADTPRWTPSSRAAGPPSARQGAPPHPPFGHLLPAGEKGTAGASPPHLPFSRRAGILPAGASQRGVSGRGRLSLMSGRFSALRGRNNRAQGRRRRTLGRPSNQRWSVPVFVSGTPPGFHTRSTPCGTPVGYREPGVRDWWGAAWDSQGAPAATLGSVVSPVPGERPRRGEGRGEGGGVLVIAVNELSASVRPGRPGRGAGLSINSCSISRKDQTHVRHNCRTHQTSNQ